jgi:hypothetical protein
MICCSPNNRLRSELINSSDHLIQFSAASVGIWQSDYHRVGGCLGRQAEGNGDERPNLSSSKNHEIWQIYSPSTLVYLCHISWPNSDHPCVRTFEGHHRWCSKTQTAVLANSLAADMTPSFNLISTFSKTAFSRWCGHPNLLLGYLLFLAWTRGSRQLYRIHDATTERHQSGDVVRADIAADGPCWVTSQDGVLFVYCVVN